MKSKSFQNDKMRLVKQIFIVVLILLNIMFLNSYYSVKKAPHVDVFEEQIIEENERKIHSLEQQLELLKNRGEVDSVEAVILNK